MTPVSPRGQRSGDGGRRATGARAERLVADRLRRGGFRIVARNLVVHRDEADLLAIDPDGRTVVIVEVKARRGGVCPPEANLTPVKLRRLTRLAERLQQRPEYADRPMRIDAVTVWWTGPGKPEIRHYASVTE